MGTPQTRAAIASSLREEARQLLADTGLFALLADRWGEPQVTGSAGYNLMVWRDIDIHMAVDAERWEEWMAFGGDLARQLESVGLGLHRATFVNDYVDPHSHEGGGLLWSDIQNSAGLAAGDYWIAASAYNLSVGPGWTASAADAGSPVGDLKITITPAPSSVGLLGLGGLVAMRRRRTV